MEKWVLEPGHTAAEFRVKHMMVTWVRGHFKDVHGEVEFHLDSPEKIGLKAKFEVSKLWTGEPHRDKHLRSADFFDAEKYPFMTFESTSSERIGGVDYRVAGNLTIRDQSHPILIYLQYLGQWKTPYWTDEGNAFSVTRIGFTGKTVLNRHQFKVSWNDAMEKGGFVVSPEVFIKVDIEALLESEMKSQQKK